MKRFVKTIGMIAIVASIFISNEYDAYAASPPCRGNQGTEVKSQTVFNNTSGSDSGILQVSQINSSYFTNSVAWYLNSSITSDYSVSWVNKETGVAKVSYTNKTSNVDNNTTQVTVAKSPIGMGLDISGSTKEFRNDAMRQFVQMVREVANAFPDQKIVLHIIQQAQGHGGVCVDNGVDVATRITQLYETMLVNNGVIPDDGWPSGFDHDNDTYDSYNHMIGQFVKNNCKVVFMLGDFKGSCNDDGSGAVSYCQDKIDKLVGRKVPIVLFEFYDGDNYSGRGTLVRNKEGKLRGNKWWDTAHSKFIDGGKCPDCGNHAEGNIGWQAAADRWSTTGDWTNGSWSGNDTSGSQTRTRTETEHQKACKTCGGSGTRTRTRTETQTRTRSRKKKEDSWNTHSWGSSSYSGWSGWSGGTAGSGKLTAAQEFHKFVNKTDAGGMISLIAESIKVVLYPTTTYTWAVSSYINTTYWDFCDANGNLYSAAALAAGQNSGDGTVLHSGGTITEKITSPVESKQYSSATTINKSDSGTFYIKLKEAYSNWLCEDGYIFPVSTAKTVTCNGTVEWTSDQTKIHPKVSKPLISITSYSGTSIKRDLPKYSISFDMDGYSTEHTSKKPSSYNSAYEDIAWCKNPAITWHQMAQLNSFPDIQSLYYSGNKNAGARSQKVDYGTTYYYTYGDKVTIAAPTYKRSGYVFDHYTVDGVNKGTSITIEKGSTKNYTIVAWWKPVDYNIYVNTNGYSYGGLEGDKWKAPYEYNQTYYPYGDEPDKSLNNTKADYTRNYVGTSYDGTNSPIEKTKVADKVDIKYNIETGKINLDAMNYTTEANNLSRKTGISSSPQPGYKWVGYSNRTKNENKVSADKTATASGSITDIDTGKKYSASLTIPEKQIGNKYYNSYWSPITYYETYNLTSGILSDIDSTNHDGKFDIECNNISIKAPKRNDRVFYGWCREYLDTFYISDQDYPNKSTAATKSTTIHSPYNTNTAFDLNPSSVNIQGEKLDTYLQNGEGIPAAAIAQNSPDNLLTTLRAKSIGNRIYTAHYYKDIWINYDLASGWYTGASLDKWNTSNKDKYSLPLQIYGRIYDDQQKFTFDVSRDILSKNSRSRNVVKSSNAVAKFYYAKQYNWINQNGKIISNGLNSDYMYTYEGSGIAPYYTGLYQPYRLLGWSTNKTKQYPDETSELTTKSLLSFMQTSSSLQASGSQTLYAKWEPILTLSVNLQRTLGELTFSDGSRSIGSANNIPDKSVKAMPNIEVLAKPGEQVTYTIGANGLNNVDVYTSFDDKLHDIYSHDGTWKDNLNPNLHEASNAADDKDGLDRHYVIDNGSVSNTFYVPKYLGTKKSYENSVGVTQYAILFTATQDSYYYKKTANRKEEVNIGAILNIQPDNNPTPSPSPDPGHEGHTGGIPDPVISVLDELRSKLKIRLH